MRVAIIDLGTNTFHLLLAHIEENIPKIIYKTNEPVRLGEDITKANLITPAAFKRGITCLQEFRKTINLHGIDIIKALATSGIRSAKNGQDFVNAAREDAGIIIDVIDGNEEANYIYQGVKWSGAITQPALIMDIGGGSTEFILCDSQKLHWKRSYNIGAARLMQAFFKSDPIHKSDQLAIRTHLESQLVDLIEMCKIHPPQILIGSAGAFESFANIINAKIDLKAISTTHIDYNAYKALAVQLINANHEERATIEGLIPLRVDMIVMATVLTDYILEKLDLKQIILSTYDLKMGVLSDFSRP